MSVTHSACRSTSKICGGGAKRRLPRVGVRLHRRRRRREITLRENCRAFDDIIFRPRCAVATPASDLRTTVLGTPIALPFILAPVGSSRMFYPRGEEVAARAAGDAGTIYTLSTLSGCRLEDVQDGDDRARPGTSSISSAAATSRRAAIERARKAGLLRARRHHRHAGRRHARARRAQRHEGAADAQSAGRCCRSSGSSSRGRAGWPASSATAA